MVAGIVKVYCPVAAPTQVAREIQAEHDQVVTQAQQALEDARQRAIDELRESMRSVLAGGPSTLPPSASLLIPGGLPLATFLA